MSKLSKIMMLVHSCVFVWGQFGGGGGGSNAPDLESGWTQPVSTPNEQRVHCQCTKDGNSGGISSKKSNSFDARTGLADYNYVGCGAHKGFQTDSQVLGYGFEWCFTQGGRNCETGIHIHKGNGGEKDKMKKDDDGKIYGGWDPRLRWKKCSGGHHECAGTEWGKRVNVNATEIGTPTEVTDWSMCCGRCNAHEECVNWSYSVHDVECRIYSEVSAEQIVDADYYYMGGKHESGSKGADLAVEDCERGRSSTDLNPCNARVLIIYDSNTPKNTFILWCFGAIATIVGCGFAAQLLPQKTPLIYIDDIVSLEFEKVDGYAIKKHWHSSDGEQTYDVTVKLYDCKVTLNAPKSIGTDEELGTIAEGELITLKVVTQYKTTFENVIEAKKQGKKVPACLIPYKQYKYPDHTEIGPHYPQPIEESHVLGADGKRSMGAGFLIDSMGIKEMPAHMTGGRYKTLEPMIMIYVSYIRWLGALCWLVYNLWHTYGCMAGQSLAEKTDEWQDTGYPDKYSYLPWQFCGTEDETIMQLVKLVLQFVVLLLVDMLGTFGVKAVLIKIDVDKFIEKYPGFADALAESKKA